MPIIMTYHTLVERDSRFVARRWQVMIIILLIGNAICNLVAAFKIHFLDENFKDNCFINSEITFKTINTDTKFDTRMAEIKRMKFDEKDQAFFDQVIIDELKSYWGKQSNCNFVSVTPLFFSSCAVIWITIFLTCGHGGNSKSFVAGKPWKIVIPALVFFIGAAIATFILLVFIKSAIDLFCVELNKHLHGNYYCGFLLEQFSLLDKDDHKFSRDCYSIILEALIIANVMWILAAIIMILRIVFVIDFQLVRVTIWDVESIMVSSEKESDNVKKDEQNNENSNILQTKSLESFSGPDNIHVSFELEGSNLKPKVI